MSVLSDWLPSFFSLPKVDTATQLRTLHVPVFTTSPIHDRAADYVKRSIYVVGGSYNPIGLDSLPGRRVFTNYGDNTVTMIMI